MAPLGIVGCSDAHLPPLSASVYIEEDGRRIGSPEVFTLAYAGRDQIFIVLDGGARLRIEVDASLPEDVLIPFEDYPGVPAPLPMRVAYEIGPGMGGDIIFELCRTDSSSEGGLEIEGRSRDAEGDLDGLAATLRVRFVGCTETDDGIALGDVTFVVEMPGE